MISNSRSRLGQEVRVVSAKPRQGVIQAECEAFAAANPTSDAIAAEASQASKNATELYKASKNEPNADTAKSLRDAAAQADFYSNCLRKIRVDLINAQLTAELEKLKTATATPPAKKPTEPPTIAPLNYDEINRLYPNGYPIPSTPSRKPFGPVWEPLIELPPFQAPPLDLKSPSRPPARPVFGEHGAIIPSRENPPVGLQACPTDRIEQWKQWYHDRMGGVSMKAILHGSRQNGLRLAAVDGALVVSVVDTNGNPVDGALVRLRQTGYLSEQLTSGGVAEFALTNFQLGPSTVEFAPPSGYAAMTQMATSINLNATVNTVEFLVEKTSIAGLVITLLGIGAGALVLL